MARVSPAAAAPPSCRGEDGRHRDPAASLRFHTFGLPHHPDCLGVIREAVQGEWCLNATQGPLGPGPGQPCHVRMAIVVPRVGILPADARFWHLPRVYAFRQASGPLLISSLHCDGLPGSPRIVADLSAGLAELFHIIGRGRRKGSGTFTSTEEFTLVMIEAVRAVRLRGLRPSQANVAEYLSQSADSHHPTCDQPQISQWCQRDFKVPWATIVSLATGKGKRPA